MSAPRHLLVRASAGTGKTHRLTSRYLALLLGGADPGGVLATTFTRKAAHEILDRVLQRLASAAGNQKDLEQLSESVGRKLSGEECLDLLARLLRGMDRIRIETIDAFFAQLARLFALDLGLPAGWRIADEAEGDLVRSEAVADAVGGAGPNTEGRRVELLGLLRDLQRQAAGQSVHRKLLEFAKIGREALLESSREAWERIEPLAAVDPSTLAAAVAALPSMKLPRTKSGKTAGSERANWVTNKRRLLECVEGGDWSGVLEVTLAQKVCAGEAEFDRVAIDAEQLAVLRPIVARALREVTEHLAQQNRASRALLERHEESYQALCREQGLLDFSDLPEALAPIHGVGAGAGANTGTSSGAGSGKRSGRPAVTDRAGDGERHFDLEHRLDGRIDHLLLDEFQDTAPVQWRVLRPIADGILGDASGEKSFFCVGDVKQSIYGWRAAEPRLLRDLEAKRPNLAGEELHKSYRSSRAVLEMVNEVFAEISQNRAFTEGKGNEKTAAIEAAREFQRQFTKHESARERGQEPPGSVCLLRAGGTDTKGGEEEKEKGNERGKENGRGKEREKEGGGGKEREKDKGYEATLTLVIERVQGILADAPRAKVGILMRRRKWIPALIQKLREAGIPASDEGGNPLTDSVAVLHALSLLHLADHPGDLAAAFHVATSPIRLRVGVARDSGIGLSPDDFLRIESASSRASSIAREVRRSLAESGYGGWLASIRPKEGDDYSAWDIERFGQLIDLALAWESRAGSRPRAFVEHVRKTKVEDPSAEQVRVMTVHGAKGLEFDAVILPELEGQLARREDRLLTMRPDPEGEIEVVTHGLKKEIAAAHAGLERVRVDVARRRMVEELCVLYVAMTRAKHRLDLIVQGREKEGGGLTYAAILRGALRRDGRNIDAAGPEGVAWEHAENTRRWFPPKLAEGGEVAAPTTSAPASTPKPTPAAAPARGAASAVAASATGAVGNKGRIGGKRSEGAERLTSAAPRPALSLAPSVRARSLPGLSPSHAKDAEPVRAAALLQPHDAMTARGRLIHRFLEEVEWIETFDRSDEDLLAIGRTIEADETVVASALAEFRAAIARPVTRGMLSRPEGDVEVWRERRFALVMPGADGKESLSAGAFDRVVIRRKGGRVISAHIIDFKTDRVHQNEIIDRARSHSDQMASYVRVLGVMTALTADRIEAQILFLAWDSTQACSDREALFREQ